MLRGIETNKQTNQKQKQKQKTKNKNKNQMTMYQYFDKVRKKVTYQELLQDPKIYSNNAHNSKMQCRKYQYSRKFEETKTKQTFCVCVIYSL